MTWNSLWWYAAAAVVAPVAVGMAVPGGTGSGVPSLSAPTPVEQGASGALRLEVAEQGNEARYRVREQLARIEFPSDAIGATSAISGGLTLADDGSPVREESKFVVDLTTLKSDSDRRDGYIQRRTLQTGDFPNAEFVPTGIRGLAAPFPTSGEHRFELFGELTVHGVTKPVTWVVTALASEQGYTGSAATAFTFADFGMEVPRVAMVLSVQDTIRLEYDFNLVAQR